MRKLLIALAVVAQPAFADSYLMSFTPEGHAQLLMEHDLALPPNPLMRGPLFWSLIDDENPHVSEYIGAAETVVVMSDAKREKLRAQCEHIDDACVDSILSEQGHD